MREMQKIQVNIRPVNGWAMLDAKKRLIPNSVRSTPSATRLAAGEGEVYPVTICVTPDPRDAKLSRFRLALKVARENLEKGTYTDSCRNLLDSVLD